GPAKLVLQRVGDCLAGERVLLELGERVARLKHVVLSEFEQAAVDVIRAGLGLNRNDAGDCLSELGIVILRGDLCFTNRLEVWIDDDYAENRIAIFSAVQLVAGAAEMLTVDNNLSGPLRILARGVLPLKLLRAGGEENELGEVAIQDWKIRDLFLVECCSNIGAVSLQQLALTSGNGNRVGHRARFEHRINFCLSVYVDDYGRNHTCLESPGLDPHFVGAGKQTFFDVQPRVVCSYCV